ncbi:MAG: type IIL restriction-modification enzyme MmeI [Planctomycetota bacterium]
MTPDEFVAKWKPSELKERSAAQEHWIDVCRMLGQPTPAEHDKTGTEYCFERGAEKTGGGDGWADVWWRNRFAVEYKGKRKDLVKAYDQLLLYRESLGNPPILMVIDLDRFEVHTNFTGTAKRVFKFSLDDIAGGDAVTVETTETTPPVLTAVEVLRLAFIQPDKLKPTITSEYVTSEASAGFARIAQSMRDRGIEPHDAAHFLMKCLFCLFSEDINLLPEKVFERSLRKGKDDPPKLKGHMDKLFAAMQTGGEFALETIPWFNGGLFDDAPALELTPGEIEDLLLASKLDWSNVEPSIFGTLFERSLDPAKRAQLGAHYTSRDDIMLVVEPVVLRPMRREWDAVREKAEVEVEKYRKAAAALAGLQGKSKQRSAQETKLRNARKKVQSLYAGLLEKFHKIRVLDPACGSGNFLYVALSELKDLEKAILQEAYSLGVGLTKLNPLVEPGQLYGIELNAYAQELAQIVVWIGYIQWHVRNGYAVPREPILKTLDNIKQMDALLVWRDAGTLPAGAGESPASQVPIPQRPDWPEAEFVVGNPPFLGGNKMRQGLGDEYVDVLFRTYDGEVEAFADLSAYWHERARALIAAGKIKRAGLLATQGIRGGASQKTLKRILETGKIFEAWSDLPWTLDGAAVHVSIVCQDGGNEEELRLDGSRVEGINADLTSAGSGDLTSAVVLSENSELTFSGSKKGGPFDLQPQLAEQMLRAVGNPNGQPNADVIRPWLNGSMCVNRGSTKFIIDFGPDATIEEAAAYETPFEYVRTHVKPVRDKNRRESRRLHWWLHSERVRGLRAAIHPLVRYIATPRVSKHRLFIWVATDVLADDGVYAFAREDDYFFGVLHSVAHERWALRLGTQLEDRPRYTPTTSFETFPFPWAPGSEPADDPLVQAIAAGAKELNDLREGWLNPPNLTEAELKKRTLTNLYNKRPEWLHLAHLKLDRAVFNAYGWNDLQPEDLYATFRPNPGESKDAALQRRKTAEDEMLKRLLALNHQRAG